MKSKRMLEFKKYFPLVLLRVPGLAYLLINNIIPLTGLIIAFKKVDFSIGILKSPWAGFDNFKFLFASPDAFTITRNTICYNLVFITLDAFLGIMVAVLLNEIRSKIAKSVYQSLLLFPFLISMVIVSYLAFAFLSSSTGVANSIRQAFGAAPKNWYAEAGAWPVILTIVHEWKGIGFNCIIYLSALVGIDHTYYEAAALDGASKIKQFTTITLPLLKPTIITLFLLSLGKMFYSDFSLFYLVPMNSGILYKTTSTIDTYVYNALMNTGNIGMSAAAGFFQSIVGFVCILSFNFIVSKIDKENALF
jgi:putative aldouronate transport system permease protein